MDERVRGNHSTRASASKSGLNDILVQVLDSEKQGRVKRIVIWCYSNQYIWIILLQDDTAITTGGNRFETKGELFNIWNGGHATSANANAAVTATNANGSSSATRAIGGLTTANETILRQSTMLQWQSRNNQPNHVRNVTFKYIF